MTNAERQRRRYARLKEAAEPSPAFRKALSIAHGASGLTLRLADLVGRRKPKDSIDVGAIRSHIDALVIDMHRLMTILKEADPDARMVVAMMGMLGEYSREASARREERWSRAARRR